MSAAGSILELRVYTLKPGTRLSFHDRFHGSILPMLERHGIAVVSAGPSLHDDDSYHLIRAFASLEQRDAQLGTFYGSDEWLSQHDAQVMAMIATYSTCVIEDGARLLS